MEPQTYCCSQEGCCPLYPNSHCNAFPQGHNRIPDTQGCRLLFQPPLAVVETLGQSLVLEILDLSVSDEVSVQALASSPLEHPEEGSLRGNVEDIKGVGKVCVILWLHIVDPDGASYLVQRKIELLEDVRFVLCKHKLLVEDRCEVLLQSFFGEHLSTL